MNVLCRKSWHFLVIIYFVALSVADGNYFYAELKRVRVLVKSNSVLNISSGEVSRVRVVAMCNFLITEDSCRPAFRFLERKKNRKTLIKKTKFKPPNASELTPKCGIPLNVP